MSQTNEEKRINKSRSDKRWRNKNLNKIRITNKLYRKNNKDKIKKYMYEYGKKNKDKMKKYKKEYYQDNKDKIKKQGRKYYQDNKDKIKVREKKYRENHKDKIKEDRENNKDKIKEYRENNKDKIKEYYENNKDKIKKHSREYYEKYKSKINRDRKKYNKIRRKNNMEFKIKSYLRKRIWAALKSYTKNGKIKSSDEYGINYKKIIEHLKPFPEDCSKYHIDHIRPLCSFNFINKDGTQNIEEIKKAFVPENHQWLLAEENLSKGRKWETEEQVRYLLI